MKNSKSVFVLGGLICGIISYITISYNNPTLGNVSESILGTPYSLSTNAEEYGKVKYLSDLNYIDALSYNGWGSPYIYKDTNINGDTISLYRNGKRIYYAKGLGIHAKGEVVYDISKYTNKYTRFIAKLGIDASQDLESPACVWFQISGSKDGKTWDVLKRTGNVTTKTGTIDVDVNVEEYNYLKIYVDPYFDITLDHSSIADAKLVPSNYINSYITYDISEVTNKDVTATISFDDNIEVENNDNRNTYTFTENGEFTFNLIDSDGNKGTATARVNWIDKTAPVATVTYDRTSLTNKDVIATITLEDDNGVIITNNGGKNTYVFEENGEFTFEYEDEAGNKGSATATVSWIDKTLPVGTITYSTKYLTNQDVTATITFDKENVTITNNEGSDTYTFAANGKFTFEYVDEAGNVGTMEAKVGWIDKIPPIADISYNITELTNQDVIVTILLSDNNGATVTNNEGKNEYTFTENEEFTFEYVDEAGNVGSTLVEVTWIDKEVPVGTVTYDISEKTNQDVTATITFDKENVTVTNNEGKNEYTFTENGEFTFEYVDKAGNIGSTLVEVTWIDKTIPTGEVTSVPVVEDNGIIDSVVTELTPSEDTTITNGNIYTLDEDGSLLDKDNNILDGYSVDDKGYIIDDKGNYLTDSENNYIVNISPLKREYIKNGEYTFDFVDEVGNIGSSTITINTINENLVESTITYSIEELTNQDVEVSITFDRSRVKITNNDGKNTYIFSENGSFTFEYVDIRGNKAIKEVTVDWIDKIAPIGTVTYDKTEKTNQDITATITFDKENVTITNNEGKNEYTFTENGEFTFEYVDEAGNVGSTLVEVTWIDKEVPVGTVTYDISEKTNQDVTATITFDKENVTVTNNEGKNEYTFTENGEFAFEYVDEAGNVGSTLVEVTWIDKEAPVAEVTYDKTELTNQDVTATITFDKENVTVTNNEGKLTYTFTENGDFTFEYVDEAGNVGTLDAKVDWIDKVVPVGTVTYNISEKTNQNVTATITFDKENVTVTNNEGKNEYTFTENGEFTFEYVDEAGNTGSTLVEVTWIDKDAPVAEITYDKTELTNQDVTATITFDKENVTITNNEGKNEYTFTENGEFTFEYVDKAGNTGSTLVEVTWIDKDAPVAEITYDKTELTNQDVTATITFNKENVTVTNNEGKLTYTFKENGEFTFEYVDEAGNVGTLDAKVDWIDKVAPTAEIEIVISKETDSVMAILRPNEVVTIINDSDYTSDDAGNLIDSNGNVVDGYKVDSEGNVTDINNNYVMNINPFKHEFIKNGEYTFRYVDAAGNVGETTAIVSVINESPAIATITYDINTSTYDDVVATIEFNRSRVKVTNNNGSNKYTFIKNGEFTFEYEDIRGNKGSITAKVDWIIEDKVIPKIYYSETSLTNQDVTAVIEFDRKNVKITNNNGSNSYTFKDNGEFTFEYEDSKGNKGRATAKVDYIDKINPSASLYYDKSSSNMVLVKVVNPSEEITYEFGNGTYIYTKNGTYPIKFYDKAGNEGIVTAVITSISENSNNNSNSSSESTNKPNTSNNNTNNGSTNKPNTSNNNTNNGSANKPNNSNNTNNESTNNNVSNIDNSTNNNISSNTPNQDNVNNSENTNNDNLSNENDGVREFGNNGIVIKGTGLGKVESLIVQEKILDSSLENELGKECEVFKVAVVDAKNEEIKLKNSSLTIRVSLNPNKEFDSIYMIKNNALIKVTNTKIDNGTIEFRTTSLGDIIIKYKDTNDSVQEKDSDNMIWYIASLGVLTVGLGIAFVRAKKIKKA
ncbi:MAG: NPCBM/NEW2 domain-containing protein [Ruminococcus sp.]|nr:NPCBM/NEW2 domain-containing protein [Ruminococcus sp.]